MGEHTGRAQTVRDAASEGRDAPWHFYHTDAYSSHMNPEALEYMHDKLRMIPVFTISAFYERC
jgi:hypothetical protein